MVRYIDTKEHDVVVTINESGVAIYTRGKQQRNVAYSRFEYHAADGMKWLIEDAQKDERGGNT